MYKKLSGFQIRFLLEVALISTGNIINTIIITIVVMLLL